MTDDELDMKNRWPGGGGLGQCHASGAGLGVTVPLGAGFAWSVPLGAELATWHVRTTPWCYFFALIVR